MHLVSAERRSGVAVLTLDSPARRNAMCCGLVAQLQEALISNAGRDDVGSILVLGSSGFCSGSDLVELAHMTPDERSGFEHDCGQLARLISNLPVPIVADVRGYAIGGGLTLAAACDVVFSEPRALWSLPEAPIGLFPAWGLGAVIDRVGRPMARRLAWGVETLDGLQAVRIGLADHLDEAPSWQAFEMAQKLADLGREQATAVKSFFAPDFEELDAASNALFRHLCGTELGGATLRKFAKKPRNPSASESEPRA